MVAGKYQNYSIPNKSSWHKNISEITGSVDGTL